MRFPQARILVFAKPPVPGRSKTRLIPALGPEGAARLHAELVQHTLLIATRAALCPVELWCTDPVDHPFFQLCRGQFDIPCQRQTGADLGERMAQAMAASLQTASPVLLIGTDRPTLTRADLEAALAALSAGHDCVLQPVEDGGYCLIGLAARHGADCAQLFEGVDWGTADVMAQTRARLQALGWRWQELDMTWDLDLPEDLPRLKGSRFQAYK